ncbi:hypothetical protein [Roseococcus suduntuyensis]|uniref:Uncharacterized protein n=1 Tax=Roseococcus suduntuyensis TaxID=455361 RepID=A0A840ADK8_9PROT|nr:hypothetical protein [Roseococcus suduntuyensis]MBB3898573.1 hypothetical protein [Roseococcus suduntuyensis]
MTILALDAAAFPATRALAQEFRSFDPRAAAAFGVAAFIAGLETSLGTT